ncbi:MAG TPA: hypothetical protein VFU49_24955 [Ktedonobacteraceae bacterium]|nr:hypothetical protein [Ktedonobacteraceae bacterium]
MMATSNSEDQNKIEGDNSSHRAEGLFPLPFEIQLQNTFPVEIIAKRFPIVVSEDQALIPTLNLSLDNIQVDEEHTQAQIVLKISVSFPTEPRLFEISFALLGIFAYTTPYMPEMVRHYLEKGSLSVLLPFARELLASLCQRIQVPILYIPMVPIAPSQSDEQ